MRSLTLLVFWGLFFGSAVADRVPFREIKGLVFVEVQVPAKDRTLLFLVDTGAEESVLSSRIASELGLNTVARERIRMPDGVRTVNRRGPLALKVGQTRFISPGALCLDLRRESRVLGVTVDGLLGMDFLDGRVVKMDFSRNSMELSSSHSPSSLAVVMPLKSNHGAVCVPMKVGIRKLHMVRVDTGCDESLRWVGNEGGTWRPRKRSEDLSFGGMLWEDVDTLCHKNVIFPGEDGMLGMGILGSFRTVVFDLRRDRLVLER